MTISFICTIQCSWTPDVETLVHTNEEGSIVLQTSSAFSIPPSHPQVLSESLIKQILQGVSQHQEKGILQELLLSDSAPLPVFSRAQIDFLTPHIVTAFSQATSEELIAFQCAGEKDGATHLSGTVTIFSPSIFFLTLKNAGNYPGNLSKMASSSKNLQRQTTLLYSKEQAILPPEEAKRLMKISSKDSWIAIDYAGLKPSVGNLQEEEHPPITSISGNQSQESQPDMNSLQEELQDLRKMIDEQAEEIRRLQQMSPE